MRLYIDDTYTVPEASRDDIQRAFDAFETIIEDHPVYAKRIGDLEAACNLGKRSLTFTGFIDRADEDWPRYYVGEARAVMGEFASRVMRDCDLPRTIVNRRLEVRAADDSFAAVDELTFTVPAPRP